MILYNNNKTFNGSSNDVKPTSPIAQVGDRLYQTDINNLLEYDGVKWNSISVGDLLAQIGSYQFAEGQTSGFTSNNFFDRDTGKFYIPVKKKVKISENPDTYTDHRGIIEVDLNSGNYVPSTRFCDLNSFDTMSSGLNVRGFAKYQNVLLVVLRDSSIPDPTPSDTSTHGVLVCINLDNLSIIWSHEYNERISDIQIIYANNKYYLALPLRRKSMMFYTIDTSVDITTSEGFSALVQCDELFTKVYGSPDDTKPEDYMHEVDENQKGQFCIVPTVIYNDASLIPTPSVQILSRIIRYTGETTSDNSFVHNKYYQCRETGENTNVYTWVQNTAQTNQLLYISAGYNGGVNVFDVTHITDNSSFADIYGHKTRVYVWSSLSHSSIWKIMNYNGTSYGFFTFSVVVNYPYVFATLSPSPSIISAEKSDDVTGYHRMGVLSLDISQLENITAILGGYNDVNGDKGFIPIDDMALATRADGTDYPPIFIKQIGTKLYLNNGDKGAAVFDVSDVHIISQTTPDYLLNSTYPKFIGNISHPLLDGVGGFCSSTGEGGTALFIMGENPPDDDVMKKRPKNLIFYNINSSLTLPNFVDPLS